MKTIKYILIFGMFSWAACSTKVDEPDPTARTYPQAYNYKTVTIPQIKKPVTETDSVNVEAYVVSILYCPPGYACAAIVGDHIILSEMLEPDSGKELLSLSVTNPLQFKEDHLYLFSVEVSEGNTDTTNHYRLLGYSK